jgi:hypothetical protein
LKKKKNPLFSIFSQIFTLAYPVSNRKKMSKCGRRKGGFRRVNDSVKNGENVYERIPSKLTLWGGLKNAKM